MEPRSTKQKAEDCNKRQAAESSAAQNQGQDSAEGGLARLIVNRSLSSLTELTPLGQPNYLSAVRDLGFWSGSYNHSFTFDRDEPAEPRQASVRPLPPEPRDREREIVAKDFGEPKFLSDLANCGSAEKKGEAGVLEMLLPGGRKRMGKSSRFRYFRPLISELCKFFQGERDLLLNGSFHLFDWQLAVAVIKRKLSPKSETDGEQTKEELELQFLQLVSEHEAAGLKRTEESHKFVFKHTIRRLRQTFLQANWGLTSPDESFYRFYFQDLVDKEPKYELSNFFDPLDKKVYRPVEGSEKSLSLKYLRRVFKSSKFKDAFESYISTPSIETSAFWHNYSSGIRKKLERFSVLGRKGSKRPKMRKGPKRK